MSLLQSACYIVTDNSIREAYNHHQHLQVRHSYQQKTLRTSDDIPDDFLDFRNALTTCAVASTPSVWQQVFSVCSLLLFSSCVEFDSRAMSCFLKVQNTAENGSSAE
jgi:hypothetical protein